MLLLLISISVSINNFVVRKGFYCFVFCQYRVSCLKYNIWGYFHYCYHLSIISKPLKIPNKQTTHLMFIVLLRSFKQTLEFFFLTAKFCLPEKCPVYISLLLTSASGLSSATKVIHWEWAPGTQSLSHCSSYQYFLTDRCNTKIISCLVIPFLMIHICISPLKHPVFPPLIDQHGH